MDGACSMFGGQQRCIQSFGGESEGKRPLGKPTCRWEGNIEMDLQEVRWRGMDSIDLTYNRDRWQALVNSATKLQVPQNAQNLTSCNWLAS